MTDLEGLRRALHRDRARTGGANEGAIIDAQRRIELGSIASMTHEDRQRLIHAPFTFQVVPPKTHAGVLIDREGTHQGARILPRRADAVSNETMPDLDDLLTLLEH